MKLLCYKFLSAFLLFSLTSEYSHTTTFYVLLTSFPYLHEILCNKTITQLNLEGLGRKCPLPLCKHYITEIIHAEI
jgi:hypothetical protein